MDAETSRVAAEAQIAGEADPKQNGDEEKTLTTSARITEPVTPCNAPVAAGNRRRRETHIELDFGRRTGWRT